MMIMSRLLLLLLAYIHSPPVSLACDLSCTSLSRRLVFSSPQTLLNAKSTFLRVLST